VPSLVWTFPNAWTRHFSITNWLTQHLKGLVSSSSPLP